MNYSSTKKPLRRAANLLMILLIHNEIRMLKGKRLRRLGGFHALRASGNDIMRKLETKKKKLCLTN